MKKILLSLLLAISFQGMAQTIADFENFNLSPNEYLNDASPLEGFTTGNVFLPNDYNENFNSWTGWAISADTDVTTPGFMNQFSAIVGEGYNGSTGYGVSFASMGSTLELTGDDAGGVVLGMYVTNGTYAYLSMLEGDGFAKKFGGESGDDPDYFKLTIKKYRDGQLSPEAVEFYLADYRFTDNSQDYIVDEWTWVDLTSLGHADSLQFTLSSTDVGGYGMNTPGYFCVDNVTTDILLSDKNQLPAETFSIFPNPFVETLTVDWKEETPANLKIWSMGGQLIWELDLAFGQNAIDFGEIGSGSFVAEIVSEGRSAGQIVLKK